MDFVEQFKAPLPDFGFVCSPLVVGDFVYVQAGAGFCKLDKQTGKVLWRVLTDGGRNVRQCVLFADLHDPRRQAATGCPDPH